MPDKKEPKGGFALFVGKPSSKEPEADNEETDPSDDGEVDHAADLGADEMDSQGAKTSAFKDLMTSLSLKDTKSGMLALEDFIKACKYGPDEES